MLDVFTKLRNIFWNITNDSSSGRELLTIHWSERFSLLADSHRPFKILMKTSAPRKLTACILRAETVQSAGVNEAVQQLFGAGRCAVMITVVLCLLINDCYFCLIHQIFPNLHNFWLTAGSWKGAWAVKSDMWNDTELLLLISLCDFMVGLHWTSAQATWTLAPYFSSDGS